MFFDIKENDSVGKMAITTILNFLIVLIAIGIPIGIWGMVLIDYYAEKMEETNTLILEQRCNYLMDDNRELEYMLEECEELNQQLIVELE